MNIVLIKVKSRANRAIAVQKVLTEYGCAITMRLGVHETSADKCAADGLIMLQVTNDKKAVAGLVRDLKKIKDITVKTVTV